MRKHWLLIAIAVLAGTLAIGAIACGDDEEDSGNGGPEPTATTEVVGTPQAAATVQVQLTDSPFAVNADPASAGVGTVTFEATNGGTIIHNLRVIKTDDDPASLPVDSATFSVDETQVDVVGSLAEIDAGGSNTLTVDLEAGNYVLICNVPTHYEAGMHTPFEVTE